MTPKVFSQHPYRCRLDWGRRGCRAAVERGDVLAIVDTLRFSTAVAVAVAHQGLIYPCSVDEDAAALAQRVGAELAVHYTQAPVQGGFSLSPRSYLGMKLGTRVVLPSPNGGTCSRYAREVPALFVGALVNARAVANAVAEVLSETDLCVTVIACGERWQTPSEDGGLRFALEDYLGAGAILSFLEQEKSPEAVVYEGAFQQVRERLHETLWDCASGRELREKGLAEDVTLAAQLNLYDAAPVMQEGLYLGR